MLILNIAAGKLKPIYDHDEKIAPRTLINLDTSYYSYTKVDIIEAYTSSWVKNRDRTNVEYYCNEDAFTFMERTQLVFDRLCLYRFLEHIPFDRLMYFIYLLSSVTRKGALVDIIVPNYKILANMILNEDVNSPEFEADNILLTTELVNEPGCPHASVWTAERAVHFFKMERRFVIKEIDENYTFDGRNIYLRFIAERI